MTALNCLSMSLSMNLISELSSQFNFGACLKCQVQKWCSFNNDSTTYAIASKCLTIINLDKYEWFWSNVNRIWWCSVYSKCMNKNRSQYILRHCSRTGEQHFQLRDWTAVHCLHLQWYFSNALIQFNLLLCMTYFWLTQQLFYFCRFRTVLLIHKKTFHYLILSTGREMSRAEQWGDCSVLT